jgi:hypothetical protein
MESGFKILLIGVVVTLFYSCNQDQAEAELDVRLEEAISIFYRNGEASYFIMPESDDYEALPNQDIHNPITKEKVTLGQFLFLKQGLPRIEKMSLAMRRTLALAATFLQKDFSQVVCKELLMEQKASVVLVVIDLWLITMKRVIWMLKETGH